MSTFYNVYLDDGLSVSTTLIGTLWAVGQLLSVPAALVTPLLTARWGIQRTFILGSLGLTLGVIVLALVPHWAAAGIGFAAISALFSITSTAIRVFSQELVPPASRGAMSGTLMMGAGLSGSAMAFGGGYLIAALGYPGLFLTGAGLTAAGTFLYWVSFRRPHAERAHEMAAD